MGFYEPWSFSQKKIKKKIRQIFNKLNNFYFNSEDLKFFLKKYLLEIISCYLYYLLYLIDKHGIIEGSRQHEGLQRLATPSPSSPQKLNALP